MLFPNLRPHNTYQGLFYTTLAFFIALSCYLLGIIFARASEIEDKQQSDKKAANLEERVNKLNTQINLLKENANVSSVEVDDGERNIHLKINGKVNKDTQLGKIIGMTLNRYKISNEKEREKWIEESKRQEEEYILNHKW